MQNIFLFYDFFFLLEVLYQNCEGKKLTGHVWENKKFATGFSEINYLNTWTFMLLPWLS